MEFCQKQVKSDCVELLSRFQRTESVRFQAFSKVWREMKFSQIFYGTVSYREQRVFSRLVLDTAYSFFMPPYSFQIRVGGLYLLYSLHQCQTASPPEHVRLALKDWDDVKKFEKDAVDAQHFDVVYILRRLMSHNAFSFTAMPTLLVYKKKRKVESSVLCEEFIEPASRPQELISSELLEELSNIHELYGKLKTSLSAVSEQTASSMNLVREDLAPQLRSTVVDFYKWQQRKAGRNENEDSGQGTSAQQESSTRASRLASIKSKAYGEAAEVSRSRRHRQVEVDFTVNEAGPSHSSAHSRTSKLSLKTRTKENIQVSGDIWKEAKTTTHIKSLTRLDFGPPEKPKSWKKFKW